MRRKIITAILCLTLCFTAAFAIGCGDKPDNGNVTAVTAVTIESKPSGAMTIGSTHALTAAVTPADAQVELVWSSSAPAVASVSDGVLTAVGAGTAMITVTVKDTDVKDSFAVAVAEPEIKNPATSVTVSGKPESVVRKGDTFALAATLVGEDPDAACTDTVAWTSSDDSVLSVDLNGAVVTKRTGTATIKAAVVGKQDELFDEYVVKVYPAASTDGVYSDDLTDVVIGGAKCGFAVATVDGNVLHGGTKYGSMAYTKDDEGKLLVSGDDVRNYDRTFFEPKFEDILSDGNYTVKVSATLVSASVDSVADAQWTLYWWSKDRATDPVFAEKENAKTILSMSQDKFVSGTFEGVGSDLVLTINTDKPLRGIAFGTNKSDVTNGSYVIRINEISFTPFAKVEGFGISNKDDLSEIRTDDENKKVEYDYTNKTGDGAATAFAVKYESSDTGVLTVDGNGNLTPIKAGTSTVKVYVEGQDEAKDSVAITVKHVPVETISITKGEAAVADTLREDVKDKTLPYILQLGYAVTGNPCAYTVEWTSENEEVATVDNNGLVTVKKVGNARITVSVVGQTAKKSVNLVVEDSTVIKVVDSIAIKVNGITAGADDVTVRLGDTVTLTYEAEVSDDSKSYEVLWSTNDDSIIDVPEASKNAPSVTLALNATGGAVIKVKVLGELETAEATVNFVVKNPLVTAIALSGVNATETMDVGESKDFTVTATPVGCDEYTLDVTFSNDGIAEVVKTETGYKVVPQKIGATKVTFTVRGIESVSTSFDLTVAGLISQSEDFATGTIEDGVYYGKNFNIGARSGGTTRMDVTKSSDGVVWSAWSLGDARLTLCYNNYDSLDFTDGKKYIARVTVKTSTSYPDAGFVTIYGYKSVATESYKNPNGGTNDVVASVNGSTARVMLAGKGIDSYFDFVLDGTNSSEFFFAYHSGSNSGKSGATVEVTITDVTVFAAGAYKDYDVEEDFESSDVTVSGLKYTGVNFDATSNSGDTMQVAAMKGTELSARVSGKGLYYVTSRVFRKGLVTTEDTEATITHPKLIFTYKGDRATEGRYKVRIPMFMTAGSDLNLAKTTTVEVYYANASGTEKSLVTKTVGWANTLTVLEGEIPAGDWNGQIVIRFFNSEVTKNSQNSKMLTYFDGVSLKLN